MTRILSIVYSVEIDLNTVQAYWQTTSDGKILITLNDGK